MELDYLEAYVGIYVDRKAGKRPLPILYLTWQSVPVLGTAFGPIWFEQLRRALRMERTRRSRWHTWKPPVWRTDKVWASFHFREDGKQEYLRCSIHSPAWFEVVKDDPRAQAYLQARGRIPPIIDGADIPDAAANWFPWKAAYQETGYYLICYGELVDPKTRTWRTRPDVPAFLCEEVDFSEVGSWERILQATAEAREKYRQHRNDG